jgi:outer membrane protein assembly factor BamB
MTSMKRTIWAVIIFFSVVAAPYAEQWPQFRGLRAGSIPDNPALPERWSETENVVWKLDLPGRGWSSPVVWDDHILLTAVIDSQEPAKAPKPGLYGGRDASAPTAPQRWVVYDVDYKTGKIRWERDVRNDLASLPIHPKNSYASETAVTDGERVYAYFGNVGLFVFDMKGTPVWSKPIGPLKTRYDWGTAASPVLHKNRIYLVHDNETQSFLAAYDARTGKDVWRVDRKEGSNWSTPFIWENDLRTELITNATDKVRSYDLNGKVLWEFSRMSQLTVPTPYARHGLLYISSGYVNDEYRPVYALRPGASGDITLKEGETSNASFAWSQPKLASQMPTTLVHGDYLYALNDRGFFNCNDAKTGKEVYGRQRLEASGFTASPWAYNGKVFALSEDGDTYVIQAGPQFKTLWKNSLNEMAMATPAVVRNNLIIRTMSKLYRIGRPG